MFENNVHIMDHINVIPSSEPIFEHDKYMTSKDFNKEFHLQLNFMWIDTKGWDNGV